MAERWSSSRRWTRARQGETPADERGVERARALLERRQHVVVDRLHRPKQLVHVSVEPAFARSAPMPLSYRARAESERRSLHAAHTSSEENAGPTRALAHWPDGWVDNRLTKKRSSLETRGSTLIFAEAYGRLAVWCRSKGGTDEKEHRHRCCGRDRRDARDRLRQHKE